MSRTTSMSTDTHPADEAFNKFWDSKDGWTQEGRKFGLGMQSDCLVTFRAGWEAAQANYGWRNIETAPKDGTAIMILFEDSDIPSIARWDDARGMDYYPCWVVTWDGHHFGKFDRPTHWMPLPPSPIADGKEENR